MGLGKMVASRGLFSGNRFFTVLSLISLAFKLARKISGNEPKTLYTRELKQGEALVISDYDDTKRK